MEAPKISPDPTDLIDQIKYIEDEARAGKFKGKPTELLVMHHLIFNSWRNRDNPENAPLGSVLRGRSSANKIAEATGITKKTAIKAMDWLESNGWIKRDPYIVPKKGHAPSKTRVLLSQTDLERRNEQIELETMLKEVGIPSVEITQG